MSGNGNVANCVLVNVYRRPWKKKNLVMGSDK